MMLALSEIFAKDDGDESLPASRVPPAAGFLGALSHHYQYMKECDV